MVSRNPEIMQTIDGDKDAPESLFRKEKLQYLTVEEVAKFTKGKLTSEVHNDRQTNKPVGNRRKVLKPETIREVRNGGFSNSAYLILDRWALNSPDKLKELEQRGDLAFLAQLDQRDTIEKRTLTSE